MTHEPHCPFHCIFLRFRTQMISSTDFLLRSEPSRSDLCTLPSLCVFVPGTALLCRASSDNHFRQYLDLHAARRGRTHIPERPVRDGLFPALRKLYLHQYKRYLG